MYCGRLAGTAVIVTGDYVVLTFHSNSFRQMEGFLIFFTAVPLGEYDKHRYSMSGKAMTFSDI